MFQPLNFLQNLQLCPKYRIKDNLIFPNSRLSNIVSVSATIFSIILLYFSSINRNLLLKFPPRIYVLMLFTSKIDVCCLTFGLIMNCMLSVFQTNKNVMMLLKFQEVHRYLSKTNDKIFFTSNWYSVIVLIIYNILTTILIGISSTLSIYALLINTIVLSFDSNIVYAMKLIHQLKDKVDQWNVQALEYQNLDENDRVRYCERMYQAYCNILDCYDIHKVTFQGTVSKKI